MKEEIVWVEKAKKPASDVQKQNQYKDPYKGYQPYDDNESDDNEDNDYGDLYVRSNYDFYNCRGSSCGVQQIFC